jgi:uncharacterized membrane protein (UPF0127 family)
MTCMPRSETDRKRAALLAARRACASMRLVLASLAIVATLAMGHASAAGSDDYPRSTLEIRSAQGRQLFSIRVADTPERQELGLMYETRLPADEGMLFPQDQPRIVSMWMKNTYIPLDMLFVDSHGRIVCLLANTAPQSLALLSCPKPVKAVLEIGGGESAGRGIKVGDRVIDGIFAGSKG